MTASTKYQYLNTNLSSYQFLETGSSPFIRTVWRGPQESWWQPFHPLATRNSRWPAIGFALMHYHLRRVLTHLTCISTRSGSKHGLETQIKVLPYIPTTEMGEFSHWRIIMDKNLIFSWYIQTHIYPYTALYILPHCSLFTCFPSSPPLQFE